MPCCSPIKARDNSFIKSDSIKLILRFSVDSAAMSDLSSNADGAGADPLGAIKALTGVYLRMGLPVPERVQHHLYQSHVPPLRWLDLLG